MAEDDEVIDQISTYIKQALSQKVAPVEVKKSLTEQGWPADIASSLVDRHATSTEYISRFKHGSKKDFSTIIKFEGASKVFGGLTVLDGINLEINKGEIFGIIGLSGSGKTTLLNALIGFIELDSGDIQYRFPALNNKFYSVFKKPTPLRKDFGFSSQDPSFYSKLTSEENLDHFGSLYYLPNSLREKNVRSILKLTELWDSKDTLAQNISGGMQKRLSIACSMIHNPSVLVLDEPTADLDPFLRHDMYELIKQINMQGTTVIITSHFLSEMEGLCHRIGILHKGKIVETGTTDELKDMYSKNHEVHFEIESGHYDAVLKDLKKHNLSIKRIVKKDRKMIIYTPEAEKVLHTLLHVLEESGENLMDVELNKPSLSEVFESVVIGNK